MEINTLRIKTNILSNQLSTATKKEMWLLYQQCYTATYIDFYQQLALYDYFAFFRKADRIIGFMGIQIQRPILQQRTYLLIRLGSAIILEKYRGKGLLQLAVLKLSRLFWSDVLTGRVLCWGNTFTYKSYLTFAKTAAHFYPNYQQVTPYALKDMIDFIGHHYFSKNYEQHHGIVKNHQHPLQDNSDQICLKFKEDPNIRFFSEINPQFERRYGLITIAPMNWPNIINLIKKVVQQNWRSMLVPRNRNNMLFYAKSLVS